MFEPMDKWLAVDFSGQPYFEHAASPLEILCEQEDKEAGEDRNIFADLADFQCRFLAYLFAGGRVEDWRAVARRLLCFSAAAYPAIYMPYLADLDDYPIGEAPAMPFPLRGLLADLAPVKIPFLHVLTAYTRPPEKNTGGSSRWITAATARLYLLARHHHPFLLGPGNLPYEELARIFGEVPAQQPAEMTAAAYRKMLDRARSRWSIRAQELLARPLERVGAHAEALFREKTFGHREACRRAARGNSHRRGTGRRKLAASIDMAALA